MSWLFTSKRTLDRKFESIRQAESELLEYAKQYGGGSGGSGGVEEGGRSSYYNIEVLDTLIPKDCILPPIKKKNDKDDNATSSSSSLSWTSWLLNCCNRQGGSGGGGVDHRSSAVSSVEVGGRHNNNYKKKKDDDYSYDHDDDDADFKKKKDENHHEKFYTIHGLRVTSTSSSSSTASSTTSPQQQSPPPLVLLHGYMNSSAYFYRNLYGLANFFPTVYSLDWLGTGLSSRPNFQQYVQDYITKKSGKDKNDNSKEKTNKKKNEVEDSTTIATSTSPSTTATNTRDIKTLATEHFFVESLECWRKQNNISKMILCGHSMGGYISVAYCEKYPQYVEKLILLSPVGVPTATPQQIQRRTQFLNQYPYRFKLYMWFYTNGYTPGNILRMIPNNTLNIFNNSWGTNLVYQYVKRRLPTIIDDNERMAVTNYLYEINARLSGSAGEYCIHNILNPYVMAKYPLLHRIPKLQISHVTFLYGQYDWMEITGGLNVQELCSSSTTTTNDTTTTISTSSTTTSSTSNSDTSLSPSFKPPNVKVYQIPNAGHLLFVDNWKDCNEGIILGGAAAAEEGTHSSTSKTSISTASTRTTSTSSSGPIEFKFDESPPKSGRNDSGSESNNNSNIDDDSDNSDDVVIVRR